MFELNTITFPVVSADLKLSKWFTTILDYLTQAMVYSNTRNLLVIYLFKSMNYQQFNHSVYLKV